MPGAAVAGRRFDPGRRDRIIDACLDVIAADGVAGTSHRRVAAAADVPLGSMTYHFAGMDELLVAAFTRYADTAAAAFAARLDGVGTTEGAVQVIAALIEEDLLAEPRGLVLTHELYTLAARHPAYRAITERWLACNRRVLRQHFDPVTARIVDALVEGLTLHRAFDVKPPPASLAQEALARVVR